jgi:aspartate kinase
MFDSLSAQDINVQMINTSEVRVNVIVDGEKGEQALESLQQAFGDALR